MNFLPLEDLLELETQEDKQSALDSKLSNLKNQNTIELKIKSIEIPSDPNIQTDDSEQFDEEITISIRRDDDYVSSGFVPIACIAKSQQYSLNSNKSNKEDTLSKLISENEEELNTHKTFNSVSVKANKNDSYKSQSVLFENLVKNYPLDKNKLEQTYDDDLRNENENEVESTLKTAKNYFETGAGLPQDLYLNYPYSFTLSSKGGSLTSDSIISAMKLKATFSSSSSNENTISQDQTCNSFTKNQKTSNHYEDEVQNKNIFQTFNKKQPTAIYTQKQTPTLNNDLSMEKKKSEIVNNNFLFNDFGLNDNRKLNEDPKHQIQSLQTTHDLTSRKLTNSSNEIYSTPDYNSKFGLNNFNQNQFTNSGGQTDQYNNNINTIPFNNSSFSYVCEKCGNISSFSFSGLLNSSTNKAGNIFISSISTISNTNGNIGTNQFNANGCYVPQANTNEIFCKDPYPNSMYDTPTLSHTNYSQNTSFISDEDTAIINSFLPNIMYLLSKNLNIDITTQKSKETFIKNSLITYLNDVYNKLLQTY